MSSRRLATAFLLCGLVLLVLGLAGWAAGLDLPLHRLFRLDPAGAATRPAILISAAGEMAVVAPVVLVAAVVLALRRRGRDAVWLVVTAASGRLFVEVVKHLVHRARPPLADRLEHVGGLSFPSAHSAGMMTTALAPATIAAALAAATVIGWSRVALAVHWPSDVLAGWGIGMIWVGAAMRIGRNAGAAAPGDRAPSRT
jgi:membrane-associated phospholipid phosphatase